MPSVVLFDCLPPNFVFCSECRVQLLSGVHSIERECLSHRVVSLCVPVRVVASPVP